MTKLADLEKSIKDLTEKVHSLIITRTYEQKDLELLDKKVELIEKQLAQHNFVIKLQTFMAAIVVTAAVTYFFKHL